MARYPRNQSCYDPRTRYRARRNGFGPPIRLSDFDGVAGDDVSALRTLSGTRLSGTPEPVSALRTL